MFARVLRIQIKVDKIDEAAELFKKGVAPLCKKQAGFEGAYYMSDPKTGEGIVLTLWEQEQAMLASEESRFFQEQVAKFLDFYAKPPIRETYEVALIAKMKKPQKLKA
jgi:heme-degrading monooxygenase HmoA